MRKRNDYQLPAPAGAATEASPREARVALPGSTGRVRTRHVALLASAAVISCCLVLAMDAPVPRWLAATSAVAPAISAEPNGTVPTREQKLAVYLVRSTLMALDNANRTDNYTVLHALSATAFQRANPAGRLSQVFQSQRQASLDLSIAALEQPEWSAPPAVGPDQRLRLAGRYRMTAGALHFALGFAAEAGAWRLDEIHVAPRPERPIEVGSAMPR